MTSLSRRPVAIVTGSSRGIGRSCAIALAEAGFNLVLNRKEDDSCNVSASDLLETIHLCGVGAVHVHGDVSEPETQKSLLQNAVARWGRVDCLVNNAGISVKTRGDILDVSTESFDACMSVNTKAVFFLSQLISAHMLRQGELNQSHRSIINITSCNSEALALSRSEYCVSKAAASMVTALWGLRLANEEIGVYEVRPGIIATEMTSPAKQKYDEFVASGELPNRRWGQPRDIASTVVSMATGKLKFTVGQSIDVDGGLHIRHF